MLPQNVPPPPLLASAVQTFWFVERLFAPPRQTFQVLPDSRIELIFNLGCPLFVLHANDPQPLAACSIVGLLDAPLSLWADGLVRVMGARFYPWGFSALFGDSFTQPLSGLHAAGDSFRDVAEQAVAQADADAQTLVSLLSAWLTEQALRATLKEDGFVAAAQYIVAERGDGALRLAELARVIAVSPRTVRRRFQQLLGRTPKTLARVARFEFMRNTLWAEPEADLADLALSAGYADQAHMQREFRQFSGQTPRQFARAAQQSRSQMST